MGRVILPSYDFIRHIYEYSFGMLVHSQVLVIKVPILSSAIFFWWGKARLITFHLTIYCLVLHLQVLTFI